MPETVSYQVLTLMLVHFGKFISKSLWSCLNILTRAIQKFALQSKLATISAHPLPFRILRVSRVLLIWYWGCFGGTCCPDGRPEQNFWHDRARLTHRWGKLLTFLIWVLFRIGRQKRYQDFRVHQWTITNLCSSIISKRSILQIKYKPIWFLRWIVRAAAHPDSQRNYLRLARRW